MTSNNLSFSLALLSLISGALVAGDLVFESCFISDPSGYHRTAARCGVYRVPENYQQAEGKQIELFVALIPAQTKHPQADPLLVLSGGPGQAASETYVQLERAFAPIRKTRDIVLLDQRGTGKSHALHCPMDETPLNPFPNHAQIRQHAQHCLQQLDADPRFYTTSVAIRDLEGLRQALAYPQWNLYGISYGTRVALHYLRRYPEQVRAVVLDGVVPADLILGPAMATDAQRALDAILQRCRETSSCAEKLLLPEETQLLATIARLNRQPVSLAVDNPNSGQTETITLNGDDIAAIIRLLSYSSETAALTPLLLHELQHRHNYSTLAKQKILLRDRFFKSLSLGMHYTVICSEDAPFYQQTDIDRHAMQASYLGVNLFEGLDALCKAWPQGLRDADFKTPVQSDKPVLLLSGEADPVTPPAYAEQAQQSLSNSHHLIVPGQAHGMLPVGCMSRLVAQFIEQGHFSELDSSCLQAIQPAPFFIDFYGPEP